MKLQQIYFRISSQSFFKSFMSLFSGNVIAQAISFVAIPFLATIYGPEPYAVLGVFVAMCSTLTPSITGKYEVAGVITRNDKDAQSLFAAAIWLLLILTAISYLIYVFLAKGINLEFNGSDFGVILPITLLLSGLNVIWLGLLNRNKYYFDMSLSLVLKALTTVCVSVLFSSNDMVNGLILGFSLGLLASNIIIIYRHIFLVKSLRLFHVNDIWTQAKNYKSFPLLNASSSLFDGLFAWLPVYFISALFSVEQLGIYFLLHRLVVAPLSLVSNSLSPIILKDSAQRLHDKKNLIYFFTKVIGGLSALGLILGAGMYVAITLVIRYGLDERWAMAELFVMPLLLLAIIRFVISTLSPIFSSTKRNDLASIWKLSSFLVSFSVYSYFASEINFFYFIICICVVETILYIFQLFMLIYAAKNPK